jgi:tetratricopeptide (TPR) repeat protein
MQTQTFRTAYLQSDRRAPLASVLALTLLAVSSASAADPWHLPSWQARAIVSIPKPSTESGVDTAAVKVLCQSRAKADGSDYRVLDAAGKPLPFQLTFHDAARYSLVSFRCADPKQRYFIYFNNPQATRAAEQIIVDEKPGAGPPKSAWIPKYGLTLETRARPRADKLKDETNPMTPDDMAKLIAGSPRKFGARYQRRISDGYNPFGSSDYYISIYRGWMNIPKAGKYKFCTISNEASFSFLDGKELIHWPGHHTTERGARGEKNATVELTAGLHYVEYYHEEVVLEQMAFLGWRPSADEGPFAPIPESIFTTPHEAAIVGYEGPKGAVPAFEPVVTDSIWPVERGEGQYTRVRFAAKGESGNAKFAWEFGDGQSAAGPMVEHVFLNVEKTYTITLSVDGQKVSWPLEIFEIEHVTDLFKEGRTSDYARLAKTSDRAKLDAAALRELAYLFAEAEEPAAALRVGEEFVQRFPMTEAIKLARVRLLMADCALRLGQGEIDKAIENYRAAIVEKMPAAEKLQAITRLIRLLGIERNEAEKALALVKTAEGVMNGSKPKSNDEADAEQKAYRQAIIAAGDVRIWQGKNDEALKFYRRADVLRGKPIPSQVRAAKIGSYPNSLREYTEGGNYGAAIDLVNEWEDLFPTDKLNGQTFFWRGKLLLLRGQQQEAIRYLARSTETTVGAIYETESRWLLANALEQAGRAGEARKELMRLVATGIQDDFTKKAREKLKK